MSERAGNPTKRLRRRKRRLLATLPLGVVAGIALSGLPAAPVAPTPGTMHSEIITLSGPQGDPTPSLTSSALRDAPAAAGPGWSAAIDVEDGTQSVASSWLGAPQGVIAVRGNAPDGWTEWVELESEPAEQPDDSARNSGGMAWFGSEGVTEVEVKVIAGTLLDLEVQPMRYDAPSDGASFGTSSAGAATAQPEILPRSSYTSKGWAYGNAGCSGGPSAASGGVKFAVVHHTTNSNTYAASDVPAMLASIYTYHTGTNGWCDTGYNFIVDRFGRIWEGRSGGITKAIVGGHAQGFNTGSVGVSLLGQYEPGASPTSASPTAAALAAVAKVVGWKLSLNGIDPTGTVSVTSGGSNKYPAGTVVNLNRVIGHRDVGQTACPGANVYSQLPGIRTAAKAYQGGGTTTTTTAPVPPPAYAPFFTADQLVKQQYRDVLRRDASSDDLAYWGSRVGNSWSPGQFIAYMETSTEADNRVHAVTRLYKAYFLRNPDHSGFTYWLNRRGEGRNLASISQSFATSSEFTRRYGSLSNAGFVDRVYRNVLGRPADAGGTTYWKSRLDGGMPRGQVMANFSQSSEYLRRTNNGAYVVGIHEALLLRAPAANVYALYEAALTNGSTTLTNLSNTLFDSAEYRARFE
ncbi:MAG: repeat protein [Ilumatobacteraceae bacterium]|nr:repeat protein [Ilumatobacteraceae bacterium]